MILSIITINRNNAAGLEKTMRSVLSQTYKNIEYIIVDGASTDNSVEVIQSLLPNSIAESEGSGWHSFKSIPLGGDLGEASIDGFWISEPDGGIYNAMNKGIRKATGDYIQILNSGDCLAADDVVERMVAALPADNGQQTTESSLPSIFYGNMIKCFPDGRKYRDRCKARGEITLAFFYHGCLNHSPAYIKRDLFDKYGLYDETLRICSDWKWYMQAIILGDVDPVYTDIDVTLFDMTGISETNKELLESERKQLLTEMINPKILADYDQWYSSMDQMARIHRYPVVKKMVWFVERCLFKYEKLKKRLKHE